MYSEILSQYVEEQLPKLYRAEYNFRPAKSADFEHTELKKFTDQSLFSHILNGLYAVTRVLDFLKEQEAIELTTEDYKKLLVAYTLHDIHKLDDVTSPEGEEFNIPIRTYEEKLEKFSLTDFVAIKPELCRAVSIHINTYSKKGTADFSKVDPQLLKLGRLADGLASSSSIDDIQQNKKLLQQVIENFKVAQEIDFVYHRLEEYRGVSTNLLHEVTSEVLADKLNLYPLFFFPDGTVYFNLGELEEVNKEELISEITTNFFDRVEDLGTIWNGVEGTFKPGYNKFEDYALLFGGPTELLDEAADKFITNYQSPGFATDLVDKRVEKYCSSREDFEEKFAVDLSWDEEEDKAQRWGIVQRALAVAKTIARFYLPKDEVDAWLIDSLNLDQEVYTRVEEHMNSRYVSDPRSKDACLVYAYHFLDTKEYKGGRSLFTVPREKLEDRLFRTLEKILGELDSLEKRLEYVNDTLGMESDLRDYLASALELSFQQEPLEASDRYQEYSRKKSGSHKRLCVLCNRYITKEVAKGDTEIKGGIIEDNIQTFSNRILPKLSNVSAHVWCPVCYLEFMLRQVFDLGFSPTADKNNSRRVYLFLFPDYFFTPDFLADSEELLDPFKNKTRLKLRRYGEETSFSQLWLTEGLIDDWIKKVQDKFQAEAEKIKEEHEDSDQRKLGEYISASPVVKNFHLFPYERSVSDNIDLKRQPTEIEMLMKAIYLGGLLQNLLGVRVYISDTPYLNSLSNREFKTALKLDITHNALRKILPAVSLGQAGESLGEIPLTKLRDLLDIWSALWEVNNHISSRDKEIANLLNELNSNDLAGAHFYKRYEQEEGYQAPDLLVQAVEILLDYFGGEKMNLARQIAKQAFELYIPASRRDGKAHRYEDLFRTAVEGIKNIQEADEEEIIARVAGKIDKRLERLSKDQGYVCNYSQADVEDFVRLVVEKLFIGRCKGSYAVLEEEVNSLADGVYFEMDKLVQNYWAEKEDN